MGDLYEKTLSSILNFLSYRERSFKEIHSKINKYLDRQKGITNKQREEVYNKVVSYLKENNLVNDFSFGCNLVFHYINGKKPYGKVGLLAKLLDKGISKDDAIRIMELLIDDEKEKELAYKAFLQKYKSADISKVDLKRKVGLYLKGRGFSKNAIGFVLSRLGS